MLLCSKRKRGVGSLYPNLIRISAKISNCRRFYGSVAELEKLIQRAVNSLGKDVVGYDGFVDLFQRYRCVGASPDLGIGQGSRGDASPVLFE